MNEKLKEAYLKWVALNPFHTTKPGEVITGTTVTSKGMMIPYRASFNGDCCKGSHFMTENGIQVERPDHMVCEREKAWRSYCRIRDTEIAKGTMFNGNRVLQ